MSTADAQIGRIVDELDKLYGENTLIFYIWGDDGPSAQGQNGTISELTAHNGIPTTIEQQLAALEEIGGLDALGGPKTDPIYHSGWAWAGATPYKGTMSIPGYLGATRNPMGVRWPAKIKPDATPRAQFHHCQRHRADDLRDSRHHTAAGGQRRSPGLDRRSEPGLHVR